jgi:CHAT domain-containing protein
MLLFLNKKYLVFILFISLIGVSQPLEKIKYDDFFASDKSNVEKLQFVDSISKLKSFPESKLSQLYHSYSAYLFNNSERQKNITYIKKAILIRKRNNSELLKKSLFNLGFYFRVNGDYFKSIKTFKELVALPGDDRLRNKGYSSMIHIYEVIGDFEKSISYFNKAERYYIKNNNLEELCSLYIKISRVYVTMDTQKYSKTIIKYLNKLDSLKSKVKKNKNHEAIFNSRLGIVYRNINDNNKALYYYRKSLKLNKKLKDSLPIAKLYNNIGYLYLKESFFEKAKIALDSSFLYINNNKRSSTLSSTLFSNYGEYYTKFNNFKIAQKYYESSIDHLIYGRNNIQYKNPNPKQLFNFINKASLLNRVIDKADFWFKRYVFEKNRNHLKQALKDYKLADEILDIIRSDSSEEISKLFWRERGASLYIKAVEVSYLLNDKSSAYIFMEKNKALLLLEDLNDFKAKLRSKLPLEIIEKDFLFKQKISKFEMINDSTKVDTLFNLKRDYELFKNSIDIKYPVYAKSKITLPVLNIKSHKATFIDDSTVSIQFIILKNKAYGFMNSNTNSELYPIKDVSVLEKEINDLSKKLQTPFYSQIDIDSYVKVSNSIFNKLIPKRIYKLIKNRKIRLAADGIIQNIPFESLVINPFDENSYLIKNNEISYVYSFSYLLSNNKLKRIPKNTFLGVAPNKFNNESLASLPNSIKEVQNINIIFDDKTFLNKDATKYNFVSNFDNYKIVHLATHSGQSNTQKPWLAFSDKKLTLNEIYATKNQADLVVLSACKTSKGKLVSGEGVMSLARGFFISGTKSVVSSLWNINDKTTKEIMNSFYLNIKEGKSKSKSLQQSKLDYLSSNSGSMASPFYWSSFVLIGDSETIDISYNSYLVICSLVLLLITSVFLLGWKFRKNI